MKIRKYDRIFITGVSSSGKTFLASRISKILDIKSYDLDNLVFKKNCYDRICEKLRDKKLKKIIKRKKWIIEGAYSRGWIESIIKKSNFIIIIDINSWLIKKRILMRTLKRKIGLVKGKKEKFSDFLELIKYAHDYPLKSLPKHREFIDKHKKEFIILKSKKQINKFLEELK